MSELPLTNIGYICTESIPF